MASPLNLSSIASRKWYLLLPAFFVAAGVAIPIVYLLIAAFSADPAKAFSLIFRSRNLTLLGNTLSLSIGVLALGLVIAFPMAWLSSRSQIPGRKILSALAILPLAIPGYVMAYALLGSFGNYGMTAQLFGWSIPRPTGYLGALLAIGFYTYPYLYINLRSAIRGLDPALEDAALALGMNRRESLFNVVLPQLKPALLSGGLIVVLHVLGDFGAVSLMGFETLSYAIYTQYASSYDRIYAACLALILLVLTALLLYFEFKTLQGLRLDSQGPGAKRRRSSSKNGFWTWLAFSWSSIVILASVFLPLFAILFWMKSGTDVFSSSSFINGAKDSLSAALPTALLCGLLALPLAYLGQRIRKKRTGIIERISYLAYAVPPLALALAFVFFTLRVVPSFYQSLTVLIAVLTIHFLAEAIGPVRSRMYQASARLEEAARSLGMKPLRAFFSVTFPLLRPALISGMSLVFIAAMKELPITLLLSPIGFDTLALNVWSYTTDAMFSKAAPFALTITLISVSVVGLVMLGTRRR